MYIQFKYTVNNHLADFLESNVSNYKGSTLKGWFNQQDAKFLRNCSMYVVVNSDYTNAGEIRTDPILIVARNQDTAMRYYYEITKKEYGSVLCEALDNCGGVSVIPTGEVI